MGILDRLFGRKRDDVAPQYARPRAQSDSRRAPAQVTDEQAVERYRYLLRTAPPETIEQAHAEAFTQLTPDQRRMVLGELSRELPEFERQSSERYDDDPRSLARMATRAEMQRPGTLERTFSGMAMPGIGLGGMMMGGFFSGFAGIIVGSWVASEFFDSSGYDQGFTEGYAAGEESSTDQSSQDAAADTYDQGIDTGDDVVDFGGDSGGSFDSGSGDFGGDFGGDVFGGYF